MTLTNPQQGRDLGCCTLEPASLDAALAVLGADAGARCLAGGATLVAGMNAGLPKPSQVVSLQDIPGLRGMIFEADGAVRNCGHDSACGRCGRIAACRRARRGPRSCLANRASGDTQHGYARRSLADADPTPIIHAHCWRPALTSNLPDRAAVVSAPSMRSSSDVSRQLSLLAKSLSE